MSQKINGKMHDQNRCSCHTPQIGLGSQLTAFPESILKNLVHRTGSKIPKLEMMSSTHLSKRPAQQEGEQADKQAVVHPGMMSVHAVGGHY